MKATYLLRCVGSAVVLLLASIWIPIIGPFFSLLTPLPFLYYSAKYGLYEGAKMGAVSLLSVGVIANLLGTPEVLFLCLEFGFLGLLISEIYRREATFGQTVAWGTGLMLLLGIAILVVISISRRAGPLEMIVAYFREQLGATLKVYEAMGPEQEAALPAREYMNVLTDVVLKVYPALLVVGTGFVVWFNVVTSRALFRLGSLKYPDFGPTDRWRAPEPMVWGVIAAGFALFLPVGSIQWTATNALIVMLVVYAFHGLSIVLFFMNKHHVPPFIRFGVYFLIFFQQIFVVALALAGLFDQWIDFRKIQGRNTTST
ncbi:MAG: YybS family protein [Deltaproteobacteria bacterium]|nr:YybS family protein [Deltaproteobacteria bacterium]